MSWLRSLISSSLIWRVGASNPTLHRPPTHPLDTHTTHRSDHLTHTPLHWVLMRETPSKICNPSESWEGNSLSTSRLEHRDRKWRKRKLLKLQVFVSELSRTGNSLDWGRQQCFCSLWFYLFCLSLWMKREITMERLYVAVPYKDYGDRWLVFLSTYMGLWLFSLVLFKSRCDRGIMLWLKLVPVCRGVIYPGKWKPWVNTDIWPSTVDLACDWCIGARVLRWWCF